MKRTGLQALEKAGLIRATRQGRFIRYAVDVEGMRELLTYLTEDCCQGRPELCGDTFRCAPNACGPGVGSQRNDRKD